MPISTKTISKPPERELLWEERIWENLSLTEEFKQGLIQNFKDFFKDCPGEFSWINWGIFFWDKRFFQLSPLFILQPKRGLEQEAEIIQNQEFLSQLEKKNFLFFQRENKEGGYLILSFEILDKYSFLWMGLLKESQNILAEKKFSVLEKFTHLLSLFLEKEYFKQAWLEQKEDFLFSEEELSKQRKWGMVGELSSGITHEINNPLQIILGKTQILMMQVKKENKTEILASLEAIERNANRISTIIKSLSDFAHYHNSSSDSFTDVNLPYILNLISTLVEGSLKSRGITFTSHISPEITTIKGNPGEIGELFLLLFLKAKQKLTQGGLLEIRFCPEKEGVRLDFKLKNNSNAKKLNDISADNFRFCSCYRIIQKHKGQMEKFIDETGDEKISIWLPTT